MKTELCPDNLDADGFGDIEMNNIVEVQQLRKTYKGRFEALKGVNLSIKGGEILALLGPNGAGKTTLISTLCGLVNPTSGTARIAGYDIVRNYRAARQLVGLVPQELSLEPFEKVINALRYSQGLFGNGRNDAVIDQTLQRLSLWDKRYEQTRALSGGMKRRVLIAKALCHQPKVLFLDEPTAGVDVELRKDMWAIVRDLKARGVTIVLTTHYIEEAENIADRIGVINKGELLLVEEKAMLMKRLGRKTLRVELRTPLVKLPKTLAEHGLELASDGLSILYSYDAHSDRSGITRLMQALLAEGLAIQDFHTTQSTLEEIFVSLLRGRTP